MKWQTKTGSLYSTHSETVGRVRIFQQMLFADFGDNLSDIIRLRSLNRNSPDMKPKRELSKTTCNVLP